MISTVTPRRRASTRVSTDRSSGTKYALAIRTLRDAEAMDSRYISLALSLPSDGELMNTCAWHGPAGLSSGKYSRACRTRLRVFNQLSMNAAWHWATTGPSILKCESRQCRGSWASPVHRSAMPAPPVNPTRPSTTSSLRWVRVLARRTLYQRNGW